MLKAIARPFLRRASEEVPEGGTVCAHCLKAIVPGTPVAHAWIGAPHPYTHATFTCYESGGAMYGGVWGEGRFIADPRLVA